MAYRQHNPKPKHKVYDVGGSSAYAQMVDRIIDVLDDDFDPSTVLVMGHTDEDGQDSYFGLRKEILDRCGEEWGKKYMPRLLYVGKPTEVQGRVRQRQPLLLGRRDVGRPAGEVDRGAERRVQRRGQESCSLNSIRLPQLRLLRCREPHGNHQGSMKSSPPLRSALLAPLRTSWSSQRNACRS